VFHFSSYWGTWSRVLSYDGTWMVEVNLTPIGCAHSSTWASDVAPVRVRQHCTVVDNRDILTNALPDDVRADMIKNLGVELVNRLLCEDILSQINWELYHRHDNGGANLADIL
jgi:hypothetical protein